MTQSILLGVNIDHVATVRQARGSRYPDPVQAAMMAEEGGADGITLHLREDRRHIQERDVMLLKEVLQTRMNLEIAVTDEMLSLAETIKPEHVCLVPEKREEITTEGGLDLVNHAQSIKNACSRLQDVGAEVSLFIDPELAAVKVAKSLGAATIEIHTGQFSNATTDAARELQLTRIRRAVALGKDMGLIVNAGHGLHYHNVEPIAAMKDINELNIGHSIISRALFVGLKQAVIEMKRLIRETPYEAPCEAQ